MVDTGKDRWEVGEPIVTYWAGPPLTDEAAAQMAQGGWNLVWATEATLGVAQRHGLRAQLRDPLIRPASLDNETRRAQLDALIARVKHHPALYSYHIDDEPGAWMFPDLARLARHIREQDPGHALYVNLYPTYAKNSQLGVGGDTVSAYQEYLREFIKTFQPDLLSFDHYNLMTKADRDQYFLNLSLVRQAAIDANLPFMNIVQASAWRPSWRVPSEEELRWLAYTSLAYGTQGISYFVYGVPGIQKHVGGMLDAEGVPTPTFWAASRLNREFVAIAAQLRELHSVGAYHAGTLPMGAAALPQDVSIGPDSPIGAVPGKPGHPGAGWLMGYFGGSATATPADASHLLVVNLDYQEARSIKLAAGRSLFVFDVALGRWQPVGADHVELSLSAGSGRLLRLDS